MRFLLISQRAKANPQYHLKDLPGHGRIDVIFRCILAATRQLSIDQGHEIMVFLKGSQPHGYLTIVPRFVSEEDDEISLAARIQSHWEKLFTVTSLGNLLSTLSSTDIYLLSEEGDKLEQHVLGSNAVVVLGAQNDLSPSDLQQLNDSMRITLGEQSLLASQAITYLRQKIL